MINKAIITSDEIMAIGGNGMIYQRENTPLAEEIIETENEIEILRDEALANDRDIIETERNKKSYWKTFLGIAGVYLGLFVVSFLGQNSELLGLDLFEAVKDYWMIYAGIDLLFGAGYLKKTYDIKVFNYKRDILDDKLSQKVAKLKSLHAEQNEKEFDKAKEKRIVDFEEQRKRYQKELNSELITKIADFEAINKPKIFVKK